MRFYQKHTIRLTWLVSLGLLLLIGCVIGTFIRSNHGGESSTGQEIFPSAESRVAEIHLTDQSDVNSAMIVASNIFGRSLPSEETQKTPSDLKRERVPSLTQLGVKLLGTVTGARAVSFAVLQDSQTGQQDIYRIGESIREARLVEILPNRVVVLFQENRFTLDIASSESRAGPGTQQRRVQVAKRTVPTLGKIRDVLMVGSASEHLVNALASVASVRRLGRGLQSLALKPNREGPEGLVVSGVSDSPVARLVGLRDGDVIRTINGHSVGNLSKAAQVLRKARKLGKADIRLIRGKKEKSLSLRSSVW